ncbi:succinyl-diaminopimelate desuccinylase [Candidatus Blochmanniella floridana]|uniref:Succinyl-diaminopimelate desuccinylase n=1 Tax=Blochmanniella floridana TaxID=203907 RepID=DAPE_BLOFL|nr:RecName: Full=Succinyl-diaminopimelate desuccinylase; Short=SDAP desuccinylase; AltName: Full=N-succinyl-LL-2,6-diaminoheptanedioate amidohydrolase [Candidatus Blochmannia floridanus]CAD83203.1 succinyl-diaminopimelate desuccinylase [Candidatus Blochmannia floridanus]
MINDLITLTQQLIRQPSITPNDCNCQKIITDYLKSLQFNIEPMNSSNTSNIWAYRYGYDQKKYTTLLFAGHTDVVPPGDIHNWQYPPFSGTVHNNIIYGRGSSDMKGALAAMLVATKSFIQKYPKHKNRIAFIITSDEEGSGIHGTKKIIKSLIHRHEHINYCIIGEPSSNNKIGDVIKNGRRGSCTGKLVIHGSQGHVAYPQFLKNPIHLAIPILSKLLNTMWDQHKSTLFPDTSIQITHLHTIPINYSTNNITPEQLILNFNFRFNDQSTMHSIHNNINKILSNYHVTYHLHWESKSEPYFSAPGKLVNIIIDIIKKYYNITPQLNTTGGTSDGRFIIQTGAEIIELGALNNTIHKVNECIDLVDLKSLSHIYFKIMEKILL